MSKRKGPEQTRPVREAWDELREVYYLVAVDLGWTSQAAGAQAVQAMTECTRRLREISAEYAVDDDGDDDEARETTP